MASLAEGSTRAFGDELFVQRERWGWEPVESVPPPTQPGASGTAQPT